MRTCSLEPLTAHGFAAYGDVISCPAHLPCRSANGGTAVRFDGIAQLALTADGGAPELSYFRVEPTRLPAICHTLERHPLSSQMFVPIGEHRMLVVVALGAQSPDPSTLRVFVTDGHAGVNYAPGTWHHAAMVLDRPGDLLVLGRSRKTEDEDVDFIRLAGSEAFSVDMPALP